MEFLLKCSLTLYIKAIYLSVLVNMCKVILLTAAFQERNKEVTLLTK